MWYKLGSDYTKIKRKAIEKMSNLDKRSEESKNWRHLYKLAKWQKGRAWHLRNNPLCVFCGEKGFAVPATVVDHIKPHKGDRGLFFDASNWQSLCSPCHDGFKQALEKNAWRVETGLDGWPVDD
jgi:5-methylcytosine-specific restriction protein A